MTKIGARTVMTASLGSLSAHSGLLFHFPSKAPLHLHYFKNRLKRTPKTTVDLMHPNQTPARLCC